MRRRAGHGSRQPEGRRRGRPARTKRAGRPRSGSGYRQLTGLLPFAPRMKRWPHRNGRMGNLRLRTHFRDLMARLNFSRARVVATVPARITTVRRPGPRRKLGRQVAAPPRRPFGTGKRFGCAGQSGPADRVRQRASLPGRDRILVQMHYSQCFASVKFSQDAWNWLFRKSVRGSEGMRRDLRGSRILITGASSGIGRSLAEQAARAGARAGPDRPLRRQAGRPGRRTRRPGGPRSRPSPPT